MEIRINTSRDWSNSFSFNNFRELLAYSNILSIVYVYVDIIQALANNLTQVEQVKSKKLQSPSLFYIIVKERMNNFTNIELTVKFIYISYVVEINNISTS